MWKCKVVQSGNKEFETYRNFPVTRMKFCMHWGPPLFNSQTLFVGHFNPLTPMSEEDRISSYNIKQTSDENRENINLGILS